MGLGNGEFLLIARLAYRCNQAPSYLRTSAPLEDLGYANAKIALGISLSAAILAIVTTSASAQTYPTRAVTVVVPFPPGSSPDGIARILAAKLTDRIGKPFIVENRPGAASLTGAADVAKAVADGYTLLVGGSSSFATGPALRKSPPYDAARDFVPLAMVASFRSCWW